MVVDLQMHLVMEMQVDMMVDLVELDVILMVDLLVYLLGDLLVELVLDLMVDLMFGCWGTCCLCYMRFSEGRFDWVIWVRLRFVGVRVGLNFPQK